MKHFLLALLLLSVTQLSAQNFLIPFAEGNLYGLMNEKGKVVVKPEFNDINWLSDRYFKTSRSIHSNDTIQTSPGRFYIQNGELKLTGIYYGDKAILKDEPFSAYEIIPGKCIVARCDKRLSELSKESFLKYGDRGRFVSLFNLAGRNVYPKNFRSLQKIDSAGKHPSLEGHSRYILFAAEKSDNEKGFFVYDAGSQKISTWLLEGLTNVRKLNADKHSRSFTFVSTDPSGHEARYTISAGSGGFQIQKLAERERHERTRKNEFQGSNDEIEERIVSVTERELEQVPTEVFYPREPDSVLRKRFRAFYASTNDSLFHVVYINEKKFIPIPAGHKPIFLRGSRDRVQNMPVILKAGSRFFLADSSGIQQTAYDSMVYFGSDYLVWKRTGSKWICGTIDKKGRTIIPMVYDSITGGIIKLEATRDPHNDSTFISFTSYTSPDNRGQKQSPYVVVTSSTLLAYKNGKASLVSGNNELLLTPSFDLVAENAVNFFKPRNTDFLVLKRDGLYGVAKKEYNSAQKKIVVETEVEPAFPYLPLFYYRDYYGIPGLTIYGLYDSNFKLRSFGTSKGKMIGL